MPATKKNYMAVDQYGNTFHNLGPHPRRALIERTGYRHVDKMYRDAPEGRTVFVGYVVGPLWCSLFEVVPVRRAV